MIDRRGGLSAVEKTVDFRSAIWSPGVESTALSLEGPHAACDVYFDARGDAAYVGATIALYVVVAGIKTLIASAVVQSGTQSAGQRIISFIGAAAEWFEISIAPTGATPTRPATISGVAYGKEPG